MAGIMRHRFVGEEREGRSVRVDDGPLLLRRRRALSSSSSSSKKNYSQPRRRSSTPPLTHPLIGSEEG
ncbi:MAG: hypothetical protein WC483_01035 [Candidatus Paceibacterota bacterium]